MNKAQQLHTVEMELVRLLEDGLLTRELIIELFTGLINEARR